MKSLAEILELKPNRQCSSCNVIRDGVMFKDIKKDQYFKTCELCRNSKKNIGIRRGQRLRRRRRLQPNQNHLRHQGRLPHHQQQVIFV
jgi:hypothetical protein